MIDLPNLPELPEMSTGTRTSESRVTPPPPPTHDPRPGQLQRVVLAALFVSGTASVLAGWLWSLPYAPLVRHGGAFAVVYAALVLAAWLPPGLLSRRVERLLDKWVANASSGFYGVMALSSFALLEFTSLLDAIGSFDIGTFEFGGLIGELVTGFSVESLMNMIWASIWPGLFFSTYPATAVLVLVAVCWSMFSACSRILPHHTLLSGKERKAERAEGFGLSRR